MTLSVSNIDSKSSCITLECLERREVFEMGGTVTSVASSALALTRYLHISPFISLIASPLNIYCIVRNMQYYYGIFKQALGLKERFYWFGQGVAALGDGIGEFLKPLMVAFEAGFKSNHLFAQVSSQILPPVMLALSGLGLLFGGWQLGRITQEYKRFKRGGEVTLPDKSDKVAMAAFEECYLPYHMNLEGLSKEERDKKLLKGITFSLICQSIGMVASAVAVAASIMLIINSGAYLGPATGMLIGTSVIGLGQVIARNLLAEKKIEKVDP